MSEMLKSGIRLTKRNFMVLLILALTISSWFYIFAFYVVLVYLAQFGAWIFLLFNLCVISSFLAGIYLINKFSGLLSIYVWALASSVTSISLIFASNPVLVGALICVSGSLYGICALTFFKYFGEITEIGERGRIGGFIGFIFLMFLPFLLLLGKVSGFLGSVIICVILNMSTLLLKLLNPERIVLPKNMWRNYLNPRRTFLLYLIPWLIFSMVNWILGKNLSSSLSKLFATTFLQTAYSLQAIMSAIGALVGGIVADWAGRKIGLTISLVLYGVNAALIGMVFLVPTNSHLLVYLSYIMNGLSWGFFLVLYFFVVWQDLADTGNGRYYSGLIIYYFSLFLGYAAPQISIPPEIIAFISSALIFLSNIFIILAEELLPSWIAEVRDITYYLYRLKKLFKVKGKAY